MEATNTAGNSGAQRLEFSAIAVDGWAFYFHPPAQVTPEQLGGLQAALNDIAGQDVGLEHCGNALVMPENRFAADIIKIGQWVLSRLEVIDGEKGVSCHVAEWSRPSE